MKLNKILYILFAIFYTFLCYSMESQNDIEIDNTIELEEIIIDKKEPNLKNLLYNLKKYTFEKRNKKIKITLKIINALPKKQARRIKNKFNRWWLKKRIEYLVKQTKNNIKRSIGMFIFSGLICFGSGVIFIKGGVTPAIILYTGSLALFILSLHQLHWTHYQLHEIQDETHALKRLKFK